MYKCQHYCKICHAMFLYVCMTVYYDVSAVSGEIILSYYDTIKEFNVPLIFPNYFIIVDAQLNDVEVGGATVFPKLNLAARPVKVIRFYAGSIYLMLHFCVMIRVCPHFVHK